jgi:hypothetical protein
MASIGNELQQWACEALDLGFGCFGDGDHSPFIVLLDDTGQRGLIDLKSASGVIDSALLENGREILRIVKSGQLYGLVWDGYLTIDGVRQDAVFVEAAAHCGTQAFVFAQAYKLKTRTRPQEKIGRPLVAASVPHQWS